VLRLKSSPRFVDMIRSLNVEPEAVRRVIDALLAYMSFLRGKSTVGGAVMQARCEMMYYARTRRADALRLP
jgi:hypothetical protein